MSLDRWCDLDAVCPEATVKVAGKSVVCRQLTTVSPVYAVSVDGEVISFARSIPRILRPAMMNYASVNIPINGVYRVSYVHELVCWAFHGKRPSPLHLVRHLDSDRFNNRPVNLEWSTYSDNSADVKSERLARVNSLFGV